jgi:predicted nucleotidyltransferase
VKDGSTDFLEILKVLSEHKVDFIIVGGICGVLHGAPVSTFDLDVVHSRSPENLDRLMSALEFLDARYRGREDLHLRPGISHLSTSGHQLLITNLGPLDLLGSIGKDHDYDELLRDAIELEIEGSRLRMLDLDALIRIKKETITDKDKVMLLVLENTLKEKTRKE